MVRTRVRWPVLGLLSLALSVGFLAGRASGDTPHADDAGARVHLVRAGDTLWEIARERVGPQGDPRIVVEEIATLNGLDGPVLVPGTELILPA